MKNLLILGLFLAILSSCATQRRCSAKFPPRVDSIYVETTKTVTIYKDTTITVTIQGKTVTDSVKIPCPKPSSGYIPPQVYAKTGLSEAWAWWEYPYIRLKLVQLDTTIQARLDNAIKETSIWRDKYQKITIVPQAERYVPTFYKICLWLWVGVIVGIAGYFGLKRLI